MQSDFARGLLPQQQRWREAERAVVHNQPACKRDGWRGASLYPLPGVTMHTLRQLWADLAFFGSHWFCRFIAFETAEGTTRQAG